MDALRTPEERFTDLPDYAFAPHYATVGTGLRMHYVDEGPSEAAPVLMLHGEPSWSYLYRHMIPVFTAAGHRAVAPDLIGFGKSDKPKRVADYSYQAHVDWVREWIEALDLRGITLICQDWGSLIGLRLAAEHEERFDRIVVANGFLPTAEHGTPFAFRVWRTFARRTPVFRAGFIVATGSHRKLSEGRARGLRRAVPELGVPSGGARVPGAGSDIAGEPGGPGQPGRLGALGPLGQTVPHAVRPS